MTVLQSDKRRRFEDEETDITAHPITEIPPGGSDLNLPPLTPSAKDGNVHPVAVVRAALEDKHVEAVLDADTGFGPVVRPKDDTLWDYKYLLSEGTGNCNIQFSPKNYPAFDGIIVRDCGLDGTGRSIHPAFENTHRHHTHYAPLRRNLAILRNYMMVEYSPGGESGKANLLMLRQMAHKLAEMLRGEAHAPHLMERIRLFLDRILGRPLPKAKFNRFLELANTPDRGIAFLYHYLRKLMATPEFLQTLSSAGQLPRDWQMIPLEQTPFSSDNMLLYSDSARMTKIAEAFEVVVQHLRSVDEMHERDKEISVEHARDILKNMRIIATGMHEEKEYDALDPRAKEAHSLLQAAVCLQGNLAGIAKNDPSLLDDPNLIDAVEVTRKVSQRVRSEEKKMAKEYRAEISTQPPSSAAPAGKSKSAGTTTKPKKENMGQVMHKMEEGINRASDTRRRLLMARMKDKSMAMALGKGGKMDAIRDGQSTMSSPKIAQVSLADPEFIQTVKQLNEPPAPEKSKDAVQDPTLIGGGARR